MKNPNRPNPTSILCGLALLAALPALAASDTWSGAATPDGNWSNAANWDTAPAANDFLFFDNGSGVQPLTTNNLAAGTTFGNLAFNSGSVSFTLAGNGVVLGTAVQDLSSSAWSGGSVTNASANAQTISFPLTNSAGHHIVTTTSGAGQLNLNGAFGLNPGATLQFVKSGGAINYSGSGLANVNGILGGWSLIGIGTTGSGDWAALDGSVNVVAYSGYTTKSGGSSMALSSSGGNAANNIKINTRSSTASTLNSTTAGTYDINTLMWSAGSPSGDQTLNLTAGQVMRLGTSGGIANINAGTRTFNVGNGSSGTITAGGAANMAGSITLAANPLDDKNQRLKINSAITDNGSGAVSVNALGWIEVKLNSTYTGGTFINRGRVQADSVASSATATGLGTGPIYVFPGAQVFFWDNGKTSVTVANNLFIAGYGTLEDKGGAVRLSGSAVTYTGTVTLLGNASIGGTGTFGAGSKFTGSGGLIIGDNWNNGAVTLNSSTANDYSGDTMINNPTSTAQNYLLIGSSSLNNIMPHGAGKGNVNLVGNSGTSWAEFDLKGSTQTINGLTNSGANAVNTFVESSAAGGVIVVGDNNATSTFSGVIRNNGGSLALTKIGSGTLTLNNADTYTGSTVISNGVLALGSSGSLSSPTIAISSGATFDVSQTSFTLAAGQTISGSGVVTGAVSTASTSVISPGFSAGTLTFQNDLTLNTGATCVMELSTTTNGANDKIVVGGNLNLAGATIQISSAALQAGRYKLITYAGSLSGTAAANLVLSYSGDQTVSLDDSIAGEIDLLVSSSFVTKLTWLGDGTANAWDFSTTNWLNGVTLAAFSNNVAVTFNDAGSKSPAVNLTGTAQPQSLVVSNNTGTYTFSGGSISGGTSLVKKGGGTLVLTESGDTFSGGIVASNGTLVIDNDSSGVTGGAGVASGATLKLGNNDANGVLPSGTVTANGTLVLNRTDDFNVGNVIAGGGTLTKTNSNIATLTNVNTFAGNVSVQAGTLRAWTQSALGTTNGTITVASGATLDHGWDTTKAIVVSGSGVGGAGALVNNSGNAIYDGNGGLTASLTLTGNTKFGGNTRWDLGGSGGATLGSGGNNFSLTVDPGVGNYMEWDNVTIDANLGDIEVASGALGIKGCGASLGNPTNTITVDAGAELTFWGETANNSGYAKKIHVLTGGTASFRPQNPNVFYNSALTLEDGANWNLINGGGSGTVMMQPIQLNGLVHLQVGDSAVTISNVISGAGGFYWDNYNNTLVLTATNTYSGVTDIKSARTLALNGNGSIANSSVISIENSGSILNATGRGDSTLTLASGQTLNGIGTVRGNLAVNSGATVAPGNSIGRLTVTNGSVTLGGTALMEIDATASTNDVLRATSSGASITFGGALTVTNLNGTLALGQSFPLFSASSYAGNFSATNLPALDPSLKWDWNSASGVLSIVASVNTAPTNIITSVSGNVLTLSWPTDHTGWRLQVQTNALATGLNTNWSDVAGSASVNSVNVPLDPANGAVFYRMVYP